MNSLIVIFFTILGSGIAAPSGYQNDVVLIGPSGIVTSHGSISHGLGIGHGVGVNLGHETIISTPVVKTVVAEPVVSVGVDHNVVKVSHGVGGHGATNVIATSIIDTPIIKTVVAKPTLSIGHKVVEISQGVVGHGVTAVTNGGGIISASVHGAKVLGPPTAPVVIAGPSGKIVADGLWGPTSNIGLSSHYL